MAESLERFAQTIEETLRDVVFDIKVLGDFINKPGDGDFHLVEVRVERDGLVVDCGSGSAIAIDAPMEISAHVGTVRVFEAARVELFGDGAVAIAAVMVRGDEVIEHFPPASERRLSRASLVTPLAEFVFAHKAPAGMRERRSSIDMSTVVLLDQPAAENP